MDFRALFHKFEGRFLSDLFLMAVSYNESRTKETPARAVKRRMISMRKGLTEVVFILDRSGSMSGLESDTIGGYNSYLKGMKEKNARVTTVLFDDKYEIIE